MAMNAGGYISPDGQWRWNGQAWEPNVPPPPTAPPGFATAPLQPTVPAASPRQHAPKVDDSFAWFLAIWPILWSFVLLGPVLVWVAAAGLYIWCCVADVRRARASGGDVSMVLAILFTPIYLWLRPKALGKSYAIPIVWSVLFLASFAVGA